MIRSAFFQGFTATDAEMLQAAAQILDTPSAELELSRNDSAAIVRMKGNDKMETDLLVYDGDGNRGLKRKIGLAAIRYHRNYGKPPNVVYVNPRALPDGAMRLGRVNVKPLSTVKRNHFLVGQEKES